MRVAAIQLTSSADRARNLEMSANLLAAAAGDGARLIVLPEMFNVLGDADVLRRRRIARRAEPPLGRRTGTPSRRLARGRKYHGASGRRIAAF